MATASLLLAFALPEPLLHAVQEPSVKEAFWRWHRHHPHSPHSHAPHSHAPHSHAPHSHSPHTHSPQSVSGPTYTQQLLGVAILGNMFAKAGVLATVPFEATQRSFFPELATANAGTYSHNDELKGYGVLMLAYTANVYWFKNGANAHTAPDGHTTASLAAPEIPNFFPSLGAGYGQQWCDAASGAPDFDNDPEFTYSTAPEGHHTAVGQSHDTQAAIYTWRRAGDTLITLAFRGSESPTFADFFQGTWDADAIGRFFTSLDEVARDWFGTDFDVAPMDDALCHRADVELHNGITTAYLGVRSNVIAGLQEAIRRATAHGNPVKIFLTGHSLGASLASLASYDLWCNKETALMVDGVQHELFGTITFGHFSTLWKRRSAEVYAEVVPVTKRMRVNACAQTREGQIANRAPPDSLPGECTPCGGMPPWYDVVGLARHATCVTVYEVCTLAESAYNYAYDYILPGNFATCDVIGVTMSGVGPLGLADADQGYFHPSDNDFQAAWVNTVGRDLDFGFRIGNDCYGAVNGFGCHLLERYSQGMRRSHVFNTGGQCDRIDDSESQKMIPDGAAPVPMSLADCLYQHGWRSATSLDTMSHDDRRNTVIVALGNRGVGSDLQAKSDAELVSLCETV